MELLKIAIIVAVIVAVIKLAMWLDDRDNKKKTINNNRRRLYELLDYMVIDHRLGDYLCDQAQRDRAEDQETRKGEVMKKYRITIGVDLLFGDNEETIFSSLMTAFREGLRMNPNLASRVDSLALLECRLIEPAPARACWRCGGSLFQEAPYHNGLCARCWQAQQSLEQRQESMEGKP